MLLKNFIEPDGKKIDPWVTKTISLDGKAEEPCPHK